jgi:XisI protein
MDRVNHYRQIIQHLLTEYSQVKPANGEIEVTPVFDVPGGHYQIVHTGWDGDRRVYDCPIHVDIKGSKVWIQQDMTDLAVADELIKQGIAKEDIVLAFQSPYLRQYTDFAVG